MKSVILSRVSSKEQAENGYSLPAQEKLLKQHSEQLGFEIAKAFSISESASGHKQRKIFKEMIEYLTENDIKILICEKVDRLTRNLRDAVMINDWLNQDAERRIYFVKENAELHKNSVSHEKFIWNIKVSTSQFYIDNLSEEVKKGQKEKLAQGWLPTRPPIGYKTVGEQGHKIHIPDENTSHLVKKLFEIYAAGNCSLLKLTEEASDIGLRSYSGKKISKSRIHGYLTDPFYIGINTWNGVESRGNQETFIEPDTFNKVQERLRAKNTPKYNKHHYLFQGMVHCAECDGQVSWETHKGHCYGHCNHYRNCSQKKSGRQDKFENILVTAMDELKITNPKLLEWVRLALKENHKDQINFYDSSLRELNVSLQNAQNRLDRLYDDKLDGKITEQQYQRKQTQYEADANSATASITKLNKANGKFRDLGVRIYDVAQKGKEIYYKIKKDEPRRTLFNMVFEELKLRDGELSYKFTEPFEYVRQAVQITNQKSSNYAEIVPILVQTFEPLKKIDNTVYMGDLDAVRSAMLPD